MTRLAIAIATVTRLAIATVVDVVGLAIATVTRLAIATGLGIVVTDVVVGAPIFSVVIRAGVVAGLAVLTAGAIVARRVRSRRAGVLFGTSASRGGFGSGAPSHSAPIGGIIV